MAKKALKALMRIHDDEFLLHRGLVALLRAILFLQTIMIRKLLLVETIFIEKIDSYLSHFDIVFFRNFGSPSQGSEHPGMFRSHFAPPIFPSTVWYKPVSDK